MVGFVDKLNDFVEKYSGPLNKWSFLIYHFYVVLLVSLVYWRFPGHVSLTFLLPVLGVKTFFHNKTRVTKSVPKFENETYIKVCP